MKRVLERMLEGWLLLAILGFIVAASGLSGASRRPCRNYRYGDHIRARFDPRKCWDTDGARWKCNDVEFDPTVVSVRQ